MVLVMGARGTLGRRLVQRLAKRGRLVRAATRDPSSLAAPAGVEVRTVDVRDQRAVRDALEGIDMVVSAIHGIAPPTRSNHPGIVDGTGSRALIDAAADAGIKRFVLVSAQGAAPEAPSRFFRVKHETEEHLRRSGVAFTIVRPPAFIELHGLKMMGEPLVAGRPVRFIGRGQTPIEWVSADDVATELADSLDRSDRDRHIVRIHGPDTLSRVAALAILEDATGRTAHRSHLPLPLAGLMRTVGGWFNPGLAYLLDAAITEGQPAQPPTHPPDVDVHATTTLRQVAERWAASVAAT